jgi:WD40 repeat protein
LLLQIAATLHHQRGIYEHYSARLKTAPVVFLATQPTPHRGSLEFIAMLADGYHTGERTQVEVHFDASPVDRLALSVAGDRRWVEESHRASNVICFGSDLPRNRTEVENAEFPVASADGQWLAYLRSEQGTSQIWLRSLQSDVPDKPVTPSAMDVWEMSFLPDDSIIFAASVKHGPSHLFIADSNGHEQQVNAEEARYPSVSPDGQWLAYSRLQNGVWNLWLRNVRTGQENELTSAQCNDISPAWEADSKTLVFASDCGRSLGLTALHRRRVVP